MNFVKKSMSMNMEKANERLFNIDKYPQHIVEAYNEFEESRELLSEHNNLLLAELKFHIDCAMALNFETSIIYANYILKEYGYKLVPATDNQITLQSDYKKPDCENDLLNDEADYDIFN